MRALILGDIHARWHHAERIYCEAMKGEEIDVLIQVGDFGYWPKSVTKVWERKFEHPCWWVDGNHENFDMLERLDEPNLGLDPYHSYPGWTDMMSRWEYKPRGHVEKGILFVGGARSIDRMQRQRGLDWFPQENISYADQKQVMESIDEYGAENIHTIISHECPASFCMSPVLRGPETYDGNRKFLESVREEVQPERWYFGHYHAPHSGQTYGTDWRCIDMVDNGDFVFVDFPDINDE